MEKEPSLISIHPFFQRFIFTVVQTLREKNFRQEDKFVIDADLVPRVSNKVMMASMGTNIIPNIPKKEPKPNLEFSKRDMSELVAPIENHIKPISKNEMYPSINIQERPFPKPSAIQIQPPKQIQHINPRLSPIHLQRRIINPPTPQIKIPTIEPATNLTTDNEKYKKIAPLLNDPSVSTIECLGKDKEITIIRAGQKQKTRITLSAEDIKEILNQVADEAHIPIIEGVFRANIPGFSISAVVSEMLGSRFVIKKATAYGLLE